MDVRNIGILSQHYTQCHNPEDIDLRYLGMIKFLTLWWGVLSITVTMPESNFSSAFLNHPLNTSLPFVFSW
jgi:hypothetical protein